MPIDSWNLGLFSFSAILLTTVSQKAIAGANDTSQSCEFITELFRKTPVSVSTFKTLSIFRSMDLISLSSSSTGSCEVPPLNPLHVKFSQLCFETCIFLRQSDTGVLLPTRQSLLPWLEGQREAFVEQSPQYT